MRIYEAHTHTHTLIGRKQEKMTLNINQMEHTLCEDLWFDTIQMIYPQIDKLWIVVRNVCSIPLNFETLTHYQILCTCYKWQPWILTFFINFFWFLCVFSSLLSQTNWLRCVTKNAFSEYLDYFLVVVMCVCVLLRLKWLYVLSTFSLVFFSSSLRSNYRFKQKQ